MSKEITPRGEDYSAWYNDIVKKAKLASNAKVRGCMIIRPYGYAIWEKMQKVLDDEFKRTGHTNAYFPLFIPKSFLSREAAHVEGFAKECAVVTHHRLMSDPDGDGVIVDPSAKLEEELIIRPTSETTIWDTYKDWIQSYRDLPIKINQWSNTVRWEMRTRLFLRTSEFLWQEGHTAHATESEAMAEVRTMLDIYHDFCRDYMALPVIRGRKSESERFGGADETFTIEALMQDGKALQAGTSHFLGTNFAKAFDVTFLNKENESEYVWGTSWGVSTRLMGALIMAHSDDKGLVLPPRLAPTQVVIVPVPGPTPEVGAYTDQIGKALTEQGITFEYDNDDQNTAGFKFAEHELRGVPIRLVVGKRDIENAQVETVRRDTGQKQNLSVENIGEDIANLLQTIQSDMLQESQNRLESHIAEVHSWDEFVQVLEEKGGFISAHWDGTAETEKAIKDATGATTRCFPLDGKEESGVCVFSGKPSVQRILFAKAY